MQSRVRMGALRLGMLRGSGRRLFGESETSFAMMNSPPIQGMRQRTAFTRRMPTHAQMVGIIKPNHKGKAKILRQIALNQLLSTIFVHYDRLMKRKSMRSYDTHVITTTKKDVPAYIEQELAKLGAKDGNSESFLNAFNTVGVGHSLFFHSQGLKPALNDMQARLRDDRFRRYSARWWSKRAGNSNLTDLQRKALTKWAGSVLKVMDRHSTKCPLPLLPHDSHDSALGRHINRFSKNIAKRKADFQLAGATKLQ